MATGDKTIVGPGGNAAYALDSDKLDGQQATAFALSNGQVFTGNIQLPVATVISSDGTIISEGNATGAPRRLATIKAVFDYAISKVDAVLTGFVHLPQEAVIDGTILAPNVGTSGDKRLATVEWVKSLGYTSGTIGGIISSTTQTNADINDNTNDLTLATTIWVKRQTALKVSASGGTLSNGIISGNSTIETSATLTGTELAYTDSSRAVASHSWVQSALQLGASKSPIRQTILYASIDTTTSLPNFIQGSNSTLDLTVTASNSEPLVLSFAHGVGANGVIDYVAVKNDTNFTTTVLANKTTYIGINRSGGGVLSLVKVNNSTTATLIPQTGAKFTPVKIDTVLDGTRISSMSDTTVCGGANAANAYDGNLIQAFAACATASGMSVSGMGIGQVWGAYRNVIAAKITSSSDAGFIAGINPNLSFSLQGSADGVTNWQVITTKTGIVDTDTTQSIYMSLPNNITPFKSHRVVVTHDGGGSHDGYIAELKFYEVPHTQYFFGINLGSMIQYNIAGSTGAWTVTDTLFIGEVTTNGTNTTEAISYAIGSYYESDWFDSSENTPFVINDGLGTKDKHVTVFYRYNDSMPEVEIGNMWTVDLTAVGQKYGVVAVNTSLSKTSLFVGSRSQPAYYNNITGVSGMTNSTLGGQYKVVVSRNF